MKKLIIYASIALLLSSCANSAGHEVVTLNRQTDDVATCAQIKTEQKQVQAIIDEVNQDKNDLTPADVIDGVLWFPLNIVAKQANYASSLKAAKSRLEMLKTMSSERKCK